MVSLVNLQPPSLGPAASQSSKRTDTTIRAHDKREVSERFKRAAPNENNRISITPSNELNRYHPSPEHRSEP